MFTRQRLSIVTALTFALIMTSAPAFSATIAAKLNLQWKSDTCKATYENWRTTDTADEATNNSCAFGLGQIMVEALVNKSDAIDKIGLMYQMIAIGNTFDDALFYSFGIRKADFFNEMDSYLISLKW